MYPGGTWMGGIDPFGDIMGTSAGPAGRRKNYLTRPNVNRQFKCRVTNTASPNEGKASAAINSFLM